MVILCIGKDGEISGMAVVLTVISEFAKKINWALLKAMNVENFSYVTNAGMTSLFIFNKDARQ